MIKKVTHIEFTKDFLFKQIAVIPCNKSGEATETSESMIGLVVAVESDTLTLQVPVIVPEFDDVLHESSSYEYNYTDNGLRAGDTFIETMHLEIKDLWCAVNRDKYPDNDEFLMVKVIELSVSDTGLINTEVKPL